MDIHSVCEYNVCEYNVCEYDAFSIRRCNSMHNDVWKMYSLPRFEDIVLLERQ